MPKNFADRLIEAIGRTDAPVCVGLDPVVEKLPMTLLEGCGVRLLANGALDPTTKPDAIAEALLAFGGAVIDCVAGRVPALKINIAFFEPHYADGIRTYFELVHRAQRAGLLVIGDIKRSDIGHSCAEYAAAHLGRSPYEPIHRVATPDAVTVNPLLGWDGVEPFANVAAETGKGLFLLVQTSNPSSVEVQGIRLEGGGTVSQRLAAMVRIWGTRPGLTGQGGYSCIGAVVAPMDLDGTARLRTEMPNAIFLVPGYGAQGKSAEQVAKCFKDDGTGAIVNASRSVIFAFADAKYAKWADDWRECIKRACDDFIHDIRSIRAQAAKST